MPITYADVYVFVRIPASHLNQSELRGSLRFMKAGKHSICSLRSVLEKSPVLENVPRNCGGFFLFVLCCFLASPCICLARSVLLAKPFAKYSITLHQQPTGLWSLVQSQVECVDIFVND